MGWTKKTDTDIKKKPETAVRSLKRKTTKVQKKITNKIDRRDSLHDSLAQLQMDEQAAINKKFNKFSCFKSLFSCLIHKQ